MMRRANQKARTRQRVHCASPRSRCPQVVLMLTLFFTSSLFVQEVATLCYRAPEALLGVRGAYSGAVDVWGCGCVLAECALHDGEPLFAARNERELLTRIVRTVAADTAALRAFPPSPVRASPLSRTRRTPLLR